MPNTGDDIDQAELLYIVDRNAKWYNHFGKQFTIVYNIKHLLIIQLSNPKIMTQDK